MKSMNFCSSLIKRNRILTIEYWILTIIIIYKHKTIFEIIPFLPTRQPIYIFLKCNSLFYLNFPFITKKNKEDWIIKCKRAVLSFAGREKVVSISLYCSWNERADWSSRCDEMERTLTLINKIAITSFDLWFSRSRISTTASNQHHRIFFLINCCFRTSFHYLY